MEQTKAKKRGRPAGRTSEGENKKKHLYQVGLKLIESEGYEKATIRKMATKAGVSPGLFYKYFPSKESLILELHEDLTTLFEMKFENIKSTHWIERSYETLEMSLNTLMPHRDELKSLIPILVGSDKQNIFSDFSQFSRIRVESLFFRAVAEAKMKPNEELLEPIARLAYMAHLAVLLFWLLDKSKNQKATKDLLLVYKKMLKPLSLAIKWGAAKSLIKNIDKILASGLNVT